MGSASEDANPFYPTNDRKEAHSASRGTSPTSTSVSMSPGGGQRVSTQLSAVSSAERSLPNIGYGSNKKTRLLLPSGFKKFVVHNVSELELLMMHNGEYAAEVAHDVSLKTRTAINARADELDIKVVNRNARMTNEDDE